MISKEIPKSTADKFPNYDSSISCKRQSFPPLSTDVWPSLNVEISAVTDSAFKDGQTSVESENYPYIHHPKSKKKWKWIQASTYLTDLNAALELQKNKIERT